MNKAEREAFYDAEIAPELLRLGKLCQDNGLSFHTIVEWNPGDTGRTMCLVEGFSLQMDLSRVLFESRGNIDAFLIYLMKRARKIGHSSIVLHQLGVPHEPEQEKSDGAA